MSSQRRLFILLLVLFASLAAGASVFRAEARPPLTTFPAPLSPQIGAKGQTLLPILQLHLAPNDLAHFEDLYEHFGEGTDPAGLAYYKTHNLWRTAALTWDGHDYAIKIKAHGNTPYRHRVGKAISLSVKIKDRGQLLGAHRFTLTVSQRVFAENALTQAMAAQVGNLSDFQMPILVQTNEEPPEPYFFEYRLGDSYMDIAGFPSLSLLGKNVSGKSGIVAYLDSNETLENRVQILAQSIESYSKKDLDPRFLREVRQRFRSFNEAVENEEVDVVASYFDPEYIAGFEAVRLFSGVMGHGTVNNFVYYDTSSGLFYPVWHRDFFLHPLSDRLNIEVMYYAGFRFPVSELLSRSDSIRQAKYKILYQQLTTPLNVATLRQLHENVLKGPVPRASTGFFLDENAKTIRTLLESSNPQGQFYIDGDDLYLGIEARSMAGLSIQSIAGHPDLMKLNSSRIVLGRSTPLDGFGVLQSHSHNHDMPLARALEGTSFFDTLGRDLLPQETQHHLLISGPFAALLRGNKQLALRLKNDATQTETEIFLEEMASPPKELKRLRETTLPVEFTSQIADRARQALHAVFQDGALHIPSGTHVLREDVVLPLGLSVVLDAGAKLKLGPGVSLLVRGNLRANGTTENPVFIDALFPRQPFGTVAALGDGNTRCQLSNLQINGGSEDFLLGAHYSGQLSLYQHNSVLLDVVRATGGRADDGANIKYSKVLIRNSQFSGNFADQLDLDVVTGLVESSNFHLGTEGSLNGDGLDLSFSALELRDNEFSELSDKGLSVGENSEVWLRGNRFQGNRLAIAVKGSSIAWVEGGSFDGNSMDFFAYKKQAIYNGGIVLLADRNGSSHYEMFGDFYSSYLRLPSALKLSDAVDISWIWSSKMLNAAESLSYRHLDFDLADDEQREKSVGVWRASPPPSTAAGAPK